MCNVALCAMSLYKKIIELIDNDAYKHYKV